MYADSGTTNSYFRLEDVKHHRNITKNPTTMHLPTCIKNNIEGHVLPDL